MPNPFQQFNAYHLLGYVPAGAPETGAAGAGLPSTTRGVGGDDNGAKPWHPDSAAFWLLGLVAATVLGIAGASVKLHAGPARAGVTVGEA